MNDALTFKTLHEQDEILFLPNAWDVLSAMVLQQAGFKAIATTSWGMANALGYNDGEGVEFEELFQQASKIIAAVNVPVSVDIESGYGGNNEQVAERVLKLAELGAAGINIEDSYKQGSGLKPVEEQSALIKDIRERLNTEGHADFFINARTDTYLQCESPLAETRVRATAYVGCGASGIFVPGLSQDSEIEELATLIKAPLNVMSLPQLTDVGQLHSLGVKRFSIGNALSDATTVFIEQQARQLLTQANTKSLYQNGEVTTQFR